MAGLHNRYLIDGEIIKPVDEAVDLGFEAGDITGVGRGKDLPDQRNDGGVLGGGGGWNRNSEEILAVARRYPPRKSVQVWRR